MKQYTREFITRCIEAHKAAFEEWPYGEMQKAWVDEKGNLCIQYINSRELYWHYKEDDSGRIIWW